MDSKKDRVSKKKLLSHLKSGKTIYNEVWWFQMDSDGAIIGGCYDPGCCQLNFSTFDIMYDNFSQDTWHL